MYGTQEPNVTPISKEYAEKLFVDENSLSHQIQMAANFSNRSQKVIQQHIEYKEAHFLTWNIFKQICGEQKRPLIIDDCNKKVIPELIKYFIGDPSSKLDLNKGIYMFGRPGVGKDFLFRVMQILVKSISFDQRQFRRASEKKIKDSVIKANEEKGSSFVKATEVYMTGDWCICDLGIDDQDFVYLYGNKYSYMETILDRRYDNFEQGKCITYITSNLLPEEIEERYGTRIASRLPQMCNLIHLEGRSKRDQLKSIKF